MGEKRGIFEREALTNLWLGAVFLGIALLTILIVPKLIGRTKEARRAATAHAQAGQTPPPNP